MDAAQTRYLYARAAPNSIVIATHIRITVDHATVSRQSLRQYADSNNISPAQLSDPRAMEQEMDF